jgi:hypothetical protein
LHVTLNEGGKRKAESGKETEEPFKSLNLKSLNLLSGSLFLQKFLIDNGIHNFTVKQIEPNIEDCYMKLAQ